MRMIPFVEASAITGSASMRSAHEKSDIDILVVGGHNMVGLQKKIAAIQKVTEREINVLSMTSNEFKTKQNTHPLLKSIRQKKKIEIL